MLRHEWHAKYHGKRFIRSLCSKVEILSNASPLLHQRENGDGKMEISREGSNRSSSTFQIVRKVMPKACILHPETRRNPFTSEKRKKSNRIESSHLLAFMFPLRCGERRHLVGIFGCPFSSRFLVSNLT